MPRKTIRSSESDRLDRPARMHEITLAQFLRAPRRWLLKVKEGEVVWIGAKGIGSFEVLCSGAYPAPTAADALEGQRRNLGNKSLLIDLDPGAVRRRKKPIP